MDSIFFVAGGTIPLGSPSYVERSADRELFEGLLGGEYCYVLNSRQMGKSSLAVRIKAKLTDAGAATAFVDLTRLGSTNVTPEQWYSGLLVETGRALGLRSEATAFLREQKEIGPAQKYFEFLTQVVNQLSQPIVIMIDEIDVVRSLSFSTDELFAGIRQLYNARTIDGSMNRLTFCLLGAALPSDLVRDARTTPFNIGRSIELRDFTIQEAQPFADPLGKDGVTALKEVFKWTGGHPFLTQALCAELVQAGSSNVETLVRRRYLNANSMESDTNLTDVRNRLLGRGDGSIDDSSRSETLSLYRVLLKRGMDDDDGDPATARIKMSGICRVDDNRLFVRNQIYRETFNKAWIKDNMPHQELRRQRKAFWRGALRSASVGTVIVVLLAFLAFNNYRLLKAAEHETYVASMRVLPLLYEHNDFVQIDKTLETMANSPSRGWEYGFWHRLIHRAIWSFKAADDFHNYTPLSEDGLHAATLSHDRKSINIYNLNTHLIEKNISISIVGVPSIYLFFYDKGKILEEYETSNRYRKVSCFDVASGSLIISKTFESEVQGSDQNELVPGHILNFQDSDLCLLDLYTLKNVRIKKCWQKAVSPTLNPDKSVIGWIETGDHGRLFMVISRTKDWQELGRVSIESAKGSPVWLSDGKTILVPGSAGRLSAVTVDRSAIRLASLKIAKDIVTVQASPIKSQFAIVEASGTANLFDFDAGKPLLNRSYSDVFFCRFFPDGKSLLTLDDSVSKQSTFGENDIPQFKLQKTVWDKVNISRQGMVIGWSSASDLFQEIDLNSSGSPAVARSPRQDDPVTYDEDADAYLKVNSSAGTTTVYLLKESRPFLTVENLSKVPSGAPRFDYCPKVGLVAITTQDQEVSLFGKDGALTGVIRTPSLITEIRITPDGNYLVCGTDEGIFVWSPTTRKLLWSTSHHGNVHPTFSMAVTLDSQVVGVAASPGVFSTYELSTGKKIVSIGSRNERIFCGEFSFDGKRIAAGTTTGEIKVFDSNTGESLSDLGDHGSPILGVKFIGMGDSLISVSEDGLIKLWKSDDLSAEKMIPPNR